ncbi:hypothetical protein CLIB1423_12S00584 [[Candida] railenensis]|uniref:NADH dehydrogenase [ubiquinone] 1 beta subcomplex subunit 9 n=1 Tax=[Candida] railenensis TaxID=45579 RepID=A0A9P0VYF2_9ASCO|nr:hypothetical protein CLIB1423_12S00584 [[Candida] railenensis]
MSNILPFTEANTKRVSSLFRQALRTAFDHSMKWDVYRREQNKIRTLFDANSKIDDSKTLEKVIANTESKLAQWKHPDPYIPPCRPGGTKYQRNAFLPAEEKVSGDW